MSAKNVKTHTPYIYKATITAFNQAKNKKLSKVYMIYFSYGV